MQLETEQPFCSLCKRERISLASEAGPGVKLCEECRGLIQTALHRTDARALAASAGAQPSGVATTYAQSFQSDASTVVRSETNSPGFFDGLSTFPDEFERVEPGDFSSVVKGSDNGSFEMHFDDDPFGPLESEANSLEAPVFDSTEHHDGPVLAIAPTSASLHDELSDLHDSLADDVVASDRSLTTGALEPDALDQQVNVETQNAEPVAEAATVDPWEDPLPAWDYSRSEWPVLMGPPRGRSFARFKVPAAVLLLLAFGAGFYYLIYPQISRDQPVPANSLLPERAPEPRAAAQTPAEPVAQSQAASTPSEAPATEQAKPQEQAQPQAQGQEKSIRDSSTVSAAATEISNSQGRFSLQAAAFPTQDGADELAQKLKSAGVPSYVVSADLPRRGRWFRVRVGRFNTAADAQKFAGEAQQRAKAAGMSLQLMVSQYDQP